jgi:glycosyltransferase involved in cell wall biosynthesis
MTPLLADDPRPELIVLSHLRWDFVWQRPQHLVSRLAARASRAVFVEEPLPVPTAAAPRIRSVPAGAVTRAWLEVPGAEPHCGFDADAAACYPTLIADHVGAAQRERIVWLYTPMALPLARLLGPDVLVYDVMDDLASFAHAPPGLRQLQRATLDAADVVFTGGRSLQQSVAAHRPDAHCFPSGVEPSHYAQARAGRRRRPRPVAGYVGVVDERLDLGLVAHLANALPEWEIRIVGPVLKTDPATLPQAPNLRYLGPQRYEDLPAVMARFDVALMPFALNEATRSISPTKTLEYLAAGLPVVSTPIPDVVASFGAVVDIQADAAAFARACERVLGHDPAERDRKVAPLLRWNHWDAIAERMAALVDEARRPTRKQEQPA